MPEAGAPGWPDAHLARYRLLPQTLSNALAAEVGLLGARCPARWPTLPAHAPPENREIQEQPVKGVVAAERRLHSTVLATLRHIDHYTE